MDFILLFLNIIAILFLPFIMSGIIKKTKAFWAGRKGASIIQPFWDFLKLLKKETVYSKTTSFVFKIMPAISLSSVLLASLFIPLLFGRALINVPFGFVIFSYILGFQKFFSLISSLDTGSSFEGMGASREACFSTCVEPAFFILMGSIAALVHTGSFEGLKLILENSGIYGFLIIILTAIALFIMLLIEGCRVPVDDPETHLELTMIHEVMILDNSGVDLAFITYSSMAKMFLIQAIIISLLIPSGVSPLFGAILFLVYMLLISIAIGTVESITARLRMSHVFEFIFVMSILALLVLVLVTYRIYGG